MKTNRLSILGVMTGTSCDGLDAACLAIGSDSWQPIWAASAPYPKTLRKQVLALQEGDHKGSIRELMELHRDLGDWYGNVLHNMISRSESAPDAIANHGQTVAHIPEAKGMGMTLQLGDPTRISQATGITVISDFRGGDMAAGGQGAPLVPLFHRSLARQLGAAAEGVAIHNVGGISNLTYIGPASKLLAFDTGPGNIWIDMAANIATKGKLNFDQGGQLAAQGRVDTKGVQKALKHPFFRKAPPKSTGRDEFTQELLLQCTRAKGPDLVATATAITVESIAQAYEKFVIRKKLPLRNIYVCGGGAKNLTLMSQLQARLPMVQITDLTNEGFDGQLIEAQAFAYFGYLALVGCPLGGSWTGAKGFGSPGHVVPGKNWQELCQKIMPLLRR